MKSALLKDLGQPLMSSKTDSETKTSPKFGKLFAQQAMTSSNPLLNALSKKIIEETFNNADTEFPAYHSSLAKIQRDDKIQLEEVQKLQQ